MSDKTTGLKRAAAALLAAGMLGLGACGRSEDLRWIGRERTATRQLELCKKIKDEALRVQCIESVWPDDGDSEGER